MLATRRMMKLTVRYVAFNSHDHAVQMPLARKVPGPTTLVTEIA